MSSRRAVIALTAIAVLAGCRPETDEAPGGRTPYEELYVAADTADGFGTDEPAGVTPVQGGATRGGALTATGNFRGTQPDAPPGNITVTQQGQQTRLLISVQRYTAGAELQPSIVAAPCGQQGATIHTVPQPIRVPDTGIASLDTNIDIPTEQLLDGRHSVRLMTPRGEGTADVVLACADLPHTSGAPVQ
ncbi:hypothetical protein BH23GEM6_BH23GEM6_02790 [soil metagenome]